LKATPDSGHAARFPIDIGVFACPLACANCSSVRSCAQPQSACRLLATTYRVMATARCGFSPFFHVRAGAVKGTSGDYAYRAKIGHFELLPNRNDIDDLK